MKRRLMISAAAAVVLLGAGWARNQLVADRQGTWVRIARGDLVSGIGVTGTLAAVDSRAFGPPQIHDMWDFKISMMAPEGSEVKAAQPILGFDTSDLRKRLEEKSAESEQAQKEIEKEKADLAIKLDDERLNLAEAEAGLRKTSLKLEAPSDITGMNERKQVELDDALARRQVEASRERIQALDRAAHARIALLESKRERASQIVSETQADIRAMSVVAPAPGTVIYTTNWRGDKHKIGDQCWRLERVLEIPNLARMIGHGDVDEVDAGKVVLGQRVTIHLDAHPDEEFQGTISKVARTVQQQEGTRDPLKVLHVDIALASSDPSWMRPGMRFQGTIELSRRRGIVLVPRSAVFASSSGPFAMRRGPFALNHAPLHLGVQNDKFVEVLAGLSPHDRVLVKGEEEAK